MLPQTKGNETNIKLPFAFIGFSMPALILSQLLMLLNGDLLVSGAFRTPAIWASAHLFLLGWALMTVMGAMYQLVPVAFLTPIWNERFGFVQFTVTASGIGSFALFLYINPGHALFPGILTLTGILMFLVQMFMTLKSQAKATVLTLFICAALFSLLGTVSLGLTLVISMATGFASEYFQAIFHSHILLGTAGWFSLLIFGFSYKMVPMFSLSHEYTMKPAPFLFAIYALGLITTLYSFIADSNSYSIMGTFLLFAGFVLFAWHIKLIIDRRVKRKLDRPFQFALLAIVLGVFIHLMVFVSAAAGVFSKFAGVLIFLYLFAWIAFSIIGYLYKIVPFLWWTHKYSKEIGKQKVPALKEMIDEKIALPLFLLFCSSVFIIVISLGLKMLQFFYIGQGLMLAAVTIFSGAVVKVIRK
ncbi:hypothetical protein [Bacillus sp. REN3]|uniref:hypothetical protein n=1 Tax=Bacillus sp. REN3 TaxID=2802440 RepID=UPI001AEE4CCA|nr:hypothetical protein [Bacillus sp. REN3]